MLNRKNIWIFQWPVSSELIISMKYRLTTKLWEAQIVLQTNSVVARDFGGCSRTEIETERASISTTGTGAAGETNTETTSIFIKYNN